MKKLIQTSQKLKKEDDWEYFDDCAVCQAMKEGRADTLEGLTAAFKEAEKKSKFVKVIEN